MEEDKLYGVRIHVGTGNAFTLDLRGAGSVYLEPGREYYFENTPINFINRLVELKKIGITYKIDSNRKGCYKTINMINYDVVAARSLLSKIKGLYDVEPKKEEPVVEEVVEEVPVVEPEVVEEVIEATPEVVEEVAEEVIDETSEEVVEDEVVEEEVVEAEPEVAESEEIEVPSVKEIEGMSKPKLLELAASLGIDSVSEINTKKEIKNAILENIGE